jgi:hypothetical protein
MPRDQTTLSPVVLRFLTLAITVVVGVQLGAPPSARLASTPAVADQKVAEDTFKVGERPEPRVCPSPFFDRLAPARPSYDVGAVSGAGEAIPSGAVTFNGRTDSERFAIVKYVPRMERGDPPRT